MYSCLYSNMPAYSTVDTVGRYLHAQIVWGWLSFSHNNTSGYDWQEVKVQPSYSLFCVDWVHYLSVSTLLYSQTMGLYLLYVCTLLHSFSIARLWTVPSL